MNDECKTLNVTLQENGIIRLQGFIIGRMATIDDFCFAELLASQQPQPESDLNMRTGDFCNTISMRKGTE